MRGKTPATLPDCTAWHCLTVWHDEREELAEVAKIGPNRARAMTPNATLAPAAGAGIGKVLAERLLADPEFLPAMISAAMEGLKANHPPRWEPASRTWGDPTPDYKTRTATLFGLLAHMEGEPIKRIVHAHLGGEGPVDPLQAMQESPALLRAAQHLVNKAQFRTRHTKPTKPAELTLEE